MTATSSSRILVLDGGMGTTLESLGHDVSGPMWGSELVVRDPRAIGAVHSGFAKYADLIETATYQMTREGFHAIGYSHDESLLHMHRGLEVALDAARPEKRGVVLSLGPYGATLKPGQEYAGFCPPPYGPRGFTEGGENTNIFRAREEAGRSTGRVGTEEEAEQALEKFHFRRLQVFRSSKRWEEVEWVAFETVPLVREIRAIRRAMKRLEEGGEGGEARGEGQGEGRGKRGKKFWVSCAFPDGHAGQMSRNGSKVVSGGVGRGGGGGGGGGSEVDGEGAVQYVSVEEVVSACLDEVEGLARPDGIGINCTGPVYLAGLVKKFTQSVEMVQQRRVVERKGDIGKDGQDEEEEEDKAPWLVLYPDGGSVYDVVTRTWTERAYTPSQWAKEVFAVAKEAGQSRSGEGGGGGGGRKTWAGVVVGGCCKTGAEEIKALRMLVDEDMIG